GTTLGSAPPRTLRVLVAERQKTLTVSSIAPLQVVDGGGIEHPLAAGVYTFGPGLALDLAGDGQRVVLPGPLTFTPGLSPVAVGGPSPGGGSGGGGPRERLSAVAVAALEDSLGGAAPAEMPSAWPPEALKAQAVAARSYALTRLRPDGQADLFGDTRSQ